MNPGLDVGVFGQGNVNQRRVFFFGTTMPIVALSASVYLWCGQLS